MNSSSSNLEKRSLLDELSSFEKGGFFDLGHPLLNRIAESFVKAAGIGAIQAVSREAYFTAIEGAGLDSGGGDVSSELSGAKKRRFPDLRGMVLEPGPDRTVRPEKPPTVHLYGSFNSKNRSM